MTLLTIGIMCICHAGQSPQHVDYIEVNDTLYNNCSPLKQVIFWDWNEEYLRYNVVGWAMRDAVEIDYRTKTARHKASGLCVRGYSIRNTTTSSDPERANGKLHPPTLRRGLIWDRN